MVTDRELPSRSGEAAADEAEETFPRSSGWLALSFVVVLLFSEAALTLPDASASQSDVATFYADHRSAVVILQLVGFAAAILLGLFALKLRAVDRWVSASCLLVAITSLASGIVIMAMAILADPSSPATVGALNSWEPRTDDLLFVATLGFGATVGLRFGGDHRLLVVLGALSASTSLLRLVIEAFGADLGPVEWLAPVVFVLLVAVMGLMAVMGRLKGSGPEFEDVVDTSAHDGGPASVV